jgi:DnaJ-class molecular chaperone
MRKLDFTPDQNCLKCKGVGIKRSKLGKDKECKSCRVKSLGTTGMGMGTTQHNLSGTGGQMRKLDFTPDQNCLKCKGVGIKRGKTGIDKECKSCRTNFLKTVGSGMGTTTQQPIGTTQHYQSGAALKEKLGFYPSPSCTQCHGTGYKAANEVCIWCPKNVGQHQEGLQSILTPSRGTIDFTPNQNCTRCKGVGLRRGKTGVEKACKTCRTNYNKTQGSSVFPSSTQQQGGNAMGRSLSFKPRLDCTLCKGIGYFGKENDICKMCATHVPAGDKLINPMNLTPQSTTQTSHKVCPACHGKGLLGCTHNY